MTARLIVAVLAMSAATAHATPQLTAALACRTRITKAGNAFAQKRRVLLLNCIDKLLRCNLLQEIDGSAPSSCVSAAETSCNNTIGDGPATPLSLSAVNFDTKVGVGCAAADFSLAVMANGAGALWYSNDVDCGASPDLPALADCLRQNINKGVDAQIGILAPRAGLLLDAAGLGASFPDLPRPPTFDVVVSATALDSGVLVSPGTISPPVGDSVRFSGDAATLPCGMNANNGHVDVDIHTLGSPCNDNASILQSFSFKEDYGPTRTVTVGPYFVDVTYCVHLKDGPCDDEVTGTIDTP